MTHPLTDVTIVGRAEMLALIDATQPISVPAKIDTGAYRNAIHAQHIYLSDDGKTLHFTLLGGHPTSGYAQQVMSTTNFRTVTIENSFGHREVRYEVKLRIKFGGKLFTASFSLADRSKKIYAVLIGRRLLNKKFIVNTAQTSVDRVALKEEFAINFPSDEEEK